MESVERFIVRLASGQEFGPAELPQVQQWAREGRVPVDALLVSVPGGEVQSVLSRPELATILGAPPTVQGALGTAAEGGPLSGLIPYRNPHALVGYYMSIASLLPFVGAIAGPGAIVLGVVGLRKRLADPRLRGMAHAWIAIILGLIGTLISATCIASGFFAALAE